MAKVKVYTDRTKIRCPEFHSVGMNFQSGKIMEKRSKKRESTTHTREMYIKEGDRSVAKRASLLKICMLDLEV